MLARPKVKSYEHIKLWLGSKPVDEVVYWADIHNCPAIQYCREHGLRGHYANYPWLRKLSQTALDVTSEYNSGSGQPITFGELYKAY